jgi:protein involved in polysaccharide export with SLBB domain
MMQTITTEKDRLQVLDFRAIKPRFWAFLGLFLCILSAFSPLRAQSATDDLLMAEDVLTVTVLDHPEFSGDVTVATNGKIQLPLAGAIVASGKTVNQVAADIRKALLRELRNPQVTVALKQAHTRRVVVSGAVTKPGIYDIRPGWRITEVLAAAGGLTVRTELAAATLNRAKQKTITLDLPRLLANGNDQANLRVKAEDVLHVAARTVPISVAGQVKNPGNYEVPIDNGVIEAIAVAGGAMPRAATTQITIKHRDGTTTPVNLVKAMEPGQIKLNVPLKSGDVVVVPESRAQVTVRGAVTKPGFVEIPDGQTLNVTEAVALAGGQTEQAALSQAVVTRIDGTIVPVDLFKAIVLGQNANNLPLKDGDVVVVPESRARVTVRGAVARPGFLEIPDGQTLQVTEALAQVGGVTDQAALFKATVTHEDGASEPVDLFKILVRGERQGNLTLKPGDIITVPEAAGITVLGEVQKPGTVRVEAGSAPLTEVLAQAGSLKIKPEDARIGITRIIGGKSQVINVDALRLINGRDASQNALLQDGDSVTVSAIESQTVYISGQVQRPGTYAIKEGDSVPELITQAGGATPEAALTRVTITERDGNLQTVDALGAIRDGKKMNVPLSAGAIVIVPTNQRTVTVLGAVNKQGTYVIPEDKPLTLADALSQAGGTRQLAKVSEIGIFDRNATGPDGKTLKRKVVAINQVSNGQLVLNQPLEEGAIVYVPEGKLSQSAWQKLTSGLSAFSLLGRVF